jgi:hypothetical protein
MVASNDRNERLGRQSTWEGGSFTNSCPLRNLEWGVESLKSTGVDGAKLEREDRVIEPPPLKPKSGLNRPAPVVF